MNEQGKATEPKRGFAQRLMPDEPRSRGEENHADIEHNALQERIDKVHSRFEANLRLARIRHAGGVLFLVVGHRGVELGGIVALVGIENLLHRRGRRKCRRQRLQEVLTRHRPSPRTNFLIDHELEDLFLVAEMLRGLLEVLFASEVLAHQVSNHAGIFLKLLRDGHSGFALGFLEELGGRLFDHVPIRQPFRIRIVCRHQARILAILQIVVDLHMLGQFQQFRIVQVLFFLCLVAGN